MLTDLSIKNLLRPDNRPAQRREVPDGKVDGLYFVLQPSGAASWAVRYRAAGKPVKLTLGPYPVLDISAARRRAKEALGEIAGGKDPAAAKRAAKEAARAAQAVDDRVEDVAQRFLDRSVKRSVGESWAKESERLIRTEINPKLGQKRLGEVRRADVHALLDGIVDRGAPIVANRVLAVFRRLCNWAVERGIIEASPCDKLKAPAPEKSRDQLLSDDELRLAWTAFDAVGEPFGPIGKLLLLTGSRLREIAEATWSEVDLTAKTLTIAKERSKNGVAHVVPLSDKAVEIISAIPRIGGKKDGFVFTTTGKTPVSGFSRAKDTIDAAIMKGLWKDAEDRGDDPGDIKAPLHWVMHDLRRSVATGLQKLGIRLEVTEAVLGHISGSKAGVVGVYQRHTWSDEKRAALDAWASKLNAIVAGKVKSKDVTDLAKVRATRRTKAAV